MTSDDLVREAQDPSTSATRLQALAVADPATWPAIAAHPQAYDGLLQWIGARGDESLRASIAARTLPDDAPTRVSPTAAPTEQPSGVEHTTVMPAPEDGAESPSGSGRRSAWLLAAIVAGVLVLLGGVAYGAAQVFGGGDDPERASSTRTSAAPTTDTPSTEPTTPTPSAPTGGGDFCDAMEEISGPGLAGLGSGVAPEDLGDVQDMVARMRQSFDELEASAPDEIKPDVAVMADFVDALGDPTGPGMADMSRNVQKYAEAAARVGQYYAQNCP